VARRPTVWGRVHCARWDHPRTLQSIWRKQLLQPRRALHACSHMQRFVFYVCRSVHRPSVLGVGSFRQPNGLLVEADQRTRPLMNTVFSK
jgi:hypothetical protein